MADLSPTPISESPASLVAVILALHRAGDRDMERRATDELRERFGMSVKFEKPKRQKAHRATS